MTASQFPDMPPTCLPPGYRDRAALLVLAAAVGALGYWLRMAAPIAANIRDDAGGVSYVVFWTLLFAALIPRIRPALLVVLVFACTCVLEFLQLWHPPWLESMRRTFIGRAVLGTTFDWTDFPPYAVGAALAWLILRVVLRLYRTSL